MLGNKNQMTKRALTPSMRNVLDRIIETATPASIPAIRDELWELNESGYDVQPYFNKLRLRTYKERES